MAANDRLPAPGEITRLLDAWNRGDDDARDRLVPLVYEALRRRAAAQLRRERGTLKPTDLVHETYLRLCAQNAGWKNREQFFGVAARLMRRIVVDRARARKAQKRGRGLRVTLSEGMAAGGPADVDVIDIDQALDELSRLDERQAHLVELRFFAGLTAEEASEALGISLSTVNREWAHARAWLFRRLKPSPASSDPGC